MVRCSRARDARGGQDECVSERFEVRLAGCRGDSRERRSRTFERLVEQLLACCLAFVYWPRFFGVKFDV